MGLPSPSKIHTRPFLLRLATRLLEKLPDVAPKFNVNLNLPDLVDGLGGGDEEDEALCPTLHLITALIDRGEEVEQSHCRHDHCHLCHIMMLELFAISSPYRHMYRIIASLRHHIIITIFQIFTTISG